MVLGGYGLFGGQIVKNLYLTTDAKIYVAGRNINKASDFIRSINRSSTAASLKAAQIDVQDTRFIDQIVTMDINLIIHTCGPYQGANYAVAEACSNAGIHYIDLADGREFVCNINQLDELAKTNQTLIISGVSSVPGLSSTVINEYQNQFSHLEHIKIYILPGNKTPRGLATIQSILSYVGKPFRIWKNNTWQTIYGWQDMEKVELNALGKRWAANCNVPDLDLIPKEYPEISTVSFKAGLEFSLLQIGTWVLSWFSRMRLISNWTNYAKPLKTISEWFLNFGTNTGGMRVDLYGLDPHQKPLHICWQLIALDGKGPIIPTIPATLMAQKIMQGKINRHGATPCMALFTLSEFQEVITALNLSESIFLTFETP